MACQKHAPCPVDESLTDEDRVGPLEVRYIPGDSPGHLAFYWSERPVLIAGNAIATWPRLDPGWPGFNVNERQHRDSLRRLAGLEATVLGVGHGDPLIEDVADRVHDVAERPASQP